MNINSAFMDINKLIDLSYDFVLDTGQKLRRVPVTVKSGLGAAAYHALTDSVRIDPPGESDTQAVIFCDICHQFAHAYQRQQLGLIPYLLKKTFMRSAIEKQPQRIGLRAVEWYLQHLLEKCTSRSCSQQETRLPPELL